MPGTLHAMTYRLHRLTDQDWQHYRDLRLAMLADTPAAYLETLEEARAHDDDEWRFRARRAAGEGNIAVTALDGRGTWVGTMAAFVTGPGTAKLVSVWLHPAHRGSSAAPLMLDAVANWARDEAGAHALRLLVHQDNTRAAAFYRRSGFTPTGHREPYPLAEDEYETEMELGLAR